MIDSQNVFFLLTKNMPPLETSRCSFWSFGPFWRGDRFLLLDLEAPPDPFLVERRLRLRCLRQIPVLCTVHSTRVLWPFLPECPRLPHDDGAHLASKVGQVGVLPPLLRPVVILTEESPDVLWSFHSSYNFFWSSLLQYWWLFKWRQTSLNVPSSKNSFVFGQSLSFYR